MTTSKTEIENAFAAGVAAGVANEREACAKACELLIAPNEFVYHPNGTTNTQTRDAFNAATIHCAKAILARGLAL